MNDPQRTAKYYRKSLAEDIKEDKRRLLGQAKSAANHLNNLVKSLENGIDDPRLYCNVDPIIPAVNRELSLRSVRLFEKLEQYRKTAFVDELTGEGK